MRVFVTGATGFIGTALVPELIAAGHQVRGLARDPARADALRAAGAEPVAGTIDDLALLTGEARAADGVVHLAFNHDFSRFHESCEDDRRVIAALGAGLAGTGGRLLVTSGTAIALPVDGAPATETGPALDSAANPRAASEEAAIALAESGVHACVVRLSQIHDPRRQGLIPFATAIARERGVYVYGGDGANRWPAAHVSDAARLYRLALERGTPGARYHVVGEEGVPVRAIAETIARRLGIEARSLPTEEAAAHYGWLGMFINRDMPASSAWTREALGWAPGGPSLLEDLGRLEVE